MRGAGTVTGGAGWRAAGIRCGASHVPLAHRVVHIAMVHRLASGASLLVAGVIMLAGAGGEERGKREQAE